MKRDLLNRAILVGVGVFSITFVYELMTAPVREPLTFSGAGAPATPLEIVERARERGRLGAGAWQRLSQTLLRRPDPLAALVDFDTRLDAETNRNDAVTAYTGYYMGYHLMLREDAEGARRAWEFALDRFTQWKDVPRPHLEHNDTIYLARTLMRLERDSEAFEAIRAVPGVTTGAPADLNAAVLLARTLAEIGHDALALRVLDGALESLPPGKLPRGLANLIDNSADWRGTGEPNAMRVSQIAGGRALRPLLARSDAYDEDLYRLARNNALVLRAAEEEERAVEIATAAAAAARREGARTGWADAWLWAAKFSAIAGDPDGAARAIASAPPGSLRADDLIDDWDLRPYMGRDDVRASVRLHGEPEEWPADQPGA